jgi:hypothetical protein
MAFAGCAQGHLPPTLGQSGLAVPTADVVRAADRAIMIDHEV